MKYKRHYTISNMVSQNGSKIIKCWTMRSTVYSVVGFLRQKNFDRHALIPAKRMWFIFIKSGKHEWGRREKLEYLKFLIETRE